MQDENCQQKSKSISSADPNYFVHFAMRHPVVIETIKCKISDFVNSNTCFCSRLYGTCISVHIKGKR